MHRLPNIRSLAFLCLSTLSISFKLPCQGEYDISHVLPWLTFKWWVKVTPETHSSRGFCNPSTCKLYRPITSSPSLHTTLLKCMLRLILSCPSPLNLRNVSLDFFVCLFFYQLEVENPLPSSSKLKIYYR